jgi:hypothetical protein
MGIAQHKAQPKFKEQGWPFFKMKCSSYCYMLYKNKNKNAQQNEEMKFF